MTWLRSFLTAMAVLACANVLHAAALIKISEIGNDIVMEGSGMLDLTDLRIRISSMALGSGVSGDPPVVLVGPPGAQTSSYVGVSLRAPDSIGDLQGFELGDGGEGDLFGASFFFPPRAEPGIVVSETYVSGDPLSGSGLFSDLTLEDLGIAPGIYTWEWGLNEHADSLTLYVAPEPSSGVTAFMMLVLAACRRQR